MMWGRPKFINDRKLERRFKGLERILQFVRRKISLVEFPRRESNPGHLTNDQRTTLTNIFPNR